MSPEGASYQPDSNEPLYPGQLPAELAEFLKDTDYACLSQATDQGTAFVMKVPGREIDSVRGAVPIELRQELYTHPAAPVIRLVFTIYDQPDTPLALESFINVGDEQQRADFAALSTQTELPLLFYDETLTHQLTKRVPYRFPQDAALLLQIAEEALQAIPPEQRDFELAKAAVLFSSDL